MNKLKGAPAYMLILPLFVVIGLIYGGIVQRFLPAVSVHGRTCTAVDFNYWYYTEYLDFTDEHYDELEALGLTPGRNLADQACEGYDSWQAYFETKALDRLAQTEALLDRASQEGYEFTPADMTGFEGELAAIDAYREEAGISMQNYVQSYYDVSMTEAIFLKNLERDYKAQAYRDHLLSSLAPSDAELAAYIADNPAPAGADYPLADLYVIWFAAPADRFTGVFGEVQAEDLAVKAQRLLALWQENGGSGEAFADLARRFSQDSDIQRDGADRDRLPEEADAWCFAEERRAGDAAYFISEGGLWVVYYRGAGESSYRVHTRRALAETACDAWLASVLPDYQPEKKFGMALAM